jgi:predicted PurR-regulated permease PerM
MEKIHISLKTILLFFAVPLALLTLWEIRGILIALVISVILMSAIAPWVDSFEKRTKLPKVVAMLAIYLSVFLVLAFVIWGVVPPLISQTRDLFGNLPFLIGEAVRILGLAVEEDQAQFVTQRAISFFEDQFGQFFANVVQVTLDIFSGILNFFAVAVFSFYLLLEREKVKNSLHFLFPHLKKAKVNHLADKVEEKLGAWLRGQLFLSVIVGLMTWLGLTILGVKFALPLAIIAGVLEIVPMIGPIIAAVPAIIVALVQDPVLALGVAALYLLVQQAENNLIVPKVMERAVGMSPLLVILSLMIGGRLFGVLGALLAVPLTSVIVLIVRDWRENLPTKEK